MPKLLEKMKLKVELIAVVVGLIVSIAGAVIGFENRYETVDASSKGDEETHARSKSHTDNMVDKYQDELLKEINQLTHDILEAKLDNTNLEIQILMQKPEFTFTLKEKQELEFLKRKRDHLEEKLGY